MQLSAAKICFDIGVKTFGDLFIEECPKCWGHGIITCPRCQGTKTLMARPMEMHLKPLVPRRPASRPVAFKWKHLKWWLRGPKTKPTPEQEEILRRGDRRAMRADAIGRPLLLHRAQDATICETCPPMLICDKDAMCMDINKMGEAMAILANFRAASLGQKIPSPFDPSAGTVSCPDCNGSGKAHRNIPKIDRVFGAEPTLWMKVCHLASAERTALYATACAPSILHESVHVAGSHVVAPVVAPVRHCVQELASTCYNLWQELQPCV